MEGPSKAEIEAINGQIGALKGSFDNLRAMINRVEKDIEKELSFKVDINVHTDMERQLRDKDIELTQLLNKKIEELRKLRGQVIKIESS